ncbi:MAG: hypothetical protein ABEK59_00685 [Halobacteria archaeon]
MYSHIVLYGELRRISLLKLETCRRVSLPTDVTYRSVKNLRAWTLTVAMTAIFLVFGVPRVRAHEIGVSGFEAPVPPEFVVPGAAATVALTALVLGFWRRSVPSFERRLFALPEPRTVKRIGGAAFFLVVTLAVYDGIFGPGAPAENLATLFVWPVWLKGMAIVSVFLGSPWGALSPWRNVNRLFSWSEGREIGFRRYPSSIGAMPALVGFVVAVGFLENLSNVPSSPIATSLLVLTYGGAMVAAGLVFSSDCFGRVDFFGMMYGLLSRTSPISFRDDGVYFKMPWNDTSKPFSMSTEAVFGVALVYTVMFDGFSNTAFYEGLTSAANGLVGDQTPYLIYLAGLTVFLSAFLATSICSRLLSGIDKTPGQVFRVYAPSLLPIAAGYEVAHSFPYVFYNLTGILHLLGMEAVSLTDILSHQSVWIVQVSLIIAGHLFAVAASHAASVERFDRYRAAHLPVALVMVGFTVVSLWIISRPVV